VELAEQWPQPASGKESRMIQLEKDSQLKRALRKESLNKSSLLPQ